MLYFISRLCIIREELRSFQWLFGKKERDRMSQQKKSQTKPKRSSYYQEDEDLDKPLTDSQRQWIYESL